MYKKLYSNNAKGILTPYQKHLFLEIVNQNSTVLIDNIFFSIKFNLINNPPTEYSSEKVEFMLEMFDVAEFHLNKLSSFFEVN